MSAVSEFVRCLVIGAGARGCTYAAHSGIRVVAVVEPVLARKTSFAREHNISSEHCFDRLEDALVARHSYEARVCIIATPDREHCAQAIACAPLFDGVLLEKPMAVTEEECKQIVEAFRASGSICAVCHVLRYTPANQKVKELCESGAIGEILSISHTEPVGCRHFAHSFVRGNWRREDTSTFSLLAKCCHDVDLISWWAGEEAVKVSSFGSLKHFHRMKKPLEAGSALRCLDCAVKDCCPYSATKLYLPEGQADPFWCRHLVNTEIDIENVMEALKTGPYGRCAYECDNDVVDHQVVNFEFKSGATGSLTMIATTHRMCERETKIYGSKGELSTTDSLTVKQFDFGTWKEIVHQHSGENIDTSKGHGGADMLTMGAFIDAVRSSNPLLVLTSVEESFKSHRLAFAAETSRRRSEVVDHVGEPLASMKLD